HRSRRDRFGLLRGRVVGALRALLPPPLSLDRRALQYRHGLCRGLRNRRSFRGPARRTAAARLLATWRRAGAGRKLPARVRRGVGLSRAANGFDSVDSVSDCVSRGAACVVGALSVSSFGIAGPEDPVCRLSYGITIPPLTSRTWPVTYPLASSLQR